MSLLNELGSIYILALIIRAEGSLLSSRTLTVLQRKAEEETTEKQSSSDNLIENNRISYQL